MMIAMTMKDGFARQTIPYGNQCSKLCSMLILIRRLIRAQTYLNWGFYAAAEFLATIYHCTRDDSAWPTRP